MRKTIFAVLSAALVSIAGFAQESTETAHKVNYQTKNTLRSTHNEFNLSYGYGTLTEVGVPMGFGISHGIIVPIGAKIESQNSIGAFGLEYMHYSNNGRFAFGGLVGYELIHCKMIETTGTKSTKDVGFISVMPSVKSIWVNREHISFYSHAAVGALFDTSDSSNVGLAFQIDPFGIDFGGEHFRGFAQVGFGNLGIIQVGVKTSF